MTKFRLKKEARQFFKEKFHYEVKPLDYWESHIISPNLLDEVDRVYVEFGTKYTESETKLKGWSSNNGDPNAYFNFTVYVNNMGAKDYRNVNIPDVMDEIQKVLNRFFKD